MKAFDDDDDDDGSSSSSRNRGGTGYVEGNRSGQWSGVVMMLMAEGKQVVQESLNCGSGVGNNGDLVVTPRILVMRKMGGSDDNDIGDW